MHGDFASTPVSVVTPATRARVYEPRSLARPPVPLPTVLCVALPVAPSRWPWIAPLEPALSVHAVQLSTPVVSLMPVDACAIRKITAWTLHQQAVATTANGNSS